MQKLFISDLHLSPERPELTLMVCAFLQQHTDISELYILGDIFNTWLGDDLIPEEYQPFTDTLTDLSKQGVNIYLMVGNRDFMLGHDFARSIQATLLPDPYAISISGKTCLIMHGDSLCIDDESYQRYRKWVRNRFLQWCFLKLPVSFRQRISDKIKQKSRDKKQYKSAMIMDVNQAETIRVMQEKQTELLIHGHTHRPDIHSLSAGHRIVLGDWQAHASYLIADDQTLTLFDHRLPEGQKSLRVL